MPMWCSGVAEAAEQAFVARLEPAEWEFDDHVPMGCSGVDHQGWARVAYIEHFMELQLALNLGFQWQEVVLMSELEAITVRIHALERSLEV